MEFESNFTKVGLKILFQTLICGIGSIARYFIITLHKESTEILFVSNEDAKKF
jgi:hypothetical protein